MMNENKPELEKEALKPELRLLKARKLLAFGKLDEKAAADLIAAMLYLEDLAPEEKITLYINSEGGGENDILSVFDVMRHLSCPVETVCTGRAHGLSALLLAGGSAGLRKAYAHSEVMLAQVSRGRTFGQATDIELETAHLLRAKQRINQLLAQLCGKSVETVAADMERKNWLFAEEAKEYGLIDEVIA